MHILALFYTSFVYTLSIHTRLPSDVLSRPSLQLLRKAKDLRFVQKNLSSLALESSSLAALLRTGVPQQKLQGV